MRLKLRIYFSFDSEASFKVFAHSADYAIMLRTQLNLKKSESSNGKKS